ncbi:DUF262 domain-containing protein [Aeromicrobium sp. 9AM]|uniref:DUF262 domain-containing protein n=1 Tax=Aeromicrobium sp. 9AM TaxID=2653126 RepID=UPI0012F0D6DD|nr:DUF262 domain-containing protein [Aeromicrobium sp. 9AM]VXC27707.1 conserved hypothetical protein [Aeromicrobium sp. 9AM]
MTETDATDSNFEVEEIPDESPDYDLTEEEGLTTAELSDLVLYTLDWSVQSLLERIGTTFDIAPTFQRRDAWTIERKSLYVESLVLGLPVPQIVLAEDPSRKGRFIVLDGKQRLVTMKQFAAPDDNFRSFKLRKMEFATELEGMTFADMQASLTAQEHAENFLAQPIRTIVVRNWKNPAVLYQVFVRLNQGSLSLSPQELRQALYPSEFTKWVNDRSAQSHPIQAARRIKREDFRMRDAEMLLRTIAFHESIEDYRGNLRKFLDDACIQGSERWKTDGQQYFEKLATRCEHAINRTILAFGVKDSFLRFEDQAFIRRFNIAVYDLMTAVLGDDSITDAEFVQHHEALSEAFKELCRTDRDFAESLVTTTKSIVATGLRISKYGRAVGDILGHELSIVPRAETLLNRP